MQTDLIIVSDYCNKCHIDPSFILMLEEDGLIHIREVEKEKYIDAAELAELEKYTRLYYDLSINIEGIDAIQHLLARMQNMQKEIQRLRNELEFYRIREFGEMDEEF